MQKVLKQAELNLLGEILDKRIFILL